ncbi:mechanosensitive ion channel domain-containing protein [Pseudomaricurvus sp.]|uniref:mechanosensitive ion channel domain-containing protein n=1 Tax=Pseudomaricurvus sp. TaxID=2004510 RepID=UPI003F6CF6BE
MKYLIVAALLVAYLVSLNFVSRAIGNFGRSKSVNLYRIEYIRKTAKMGLTTFFVIILFLLLGIQYSQLSVFLSSVFAVIGVALFAQWSIISNMTASLIIFFFFPYRVGDQVRVVDKDDDISGCIQEISLFHVLIRRDGELITYPNNLILQKAVIKNPKPRVEIPVTDVNAED